eukprot:jgi/Tetstr1/423519/TSEL_014194.t2
MGCSASVPRCGGVAPAAVRPSEEKAATREEVTPFRSESVEDVEESVMPVDSAGSARLCWAQEPSAGGGAQSAKAAPGEACRSGAATSVAKPSPEGPPTQASARSSLDRIKTWWGGKHGIEQRGGLRFSSYSILETKSKPNPSARGQSLFNSSSSIRLAQATSIRNNISQDRMAQARARMRRSYDHAAMPSYKQKSFEPEHGGLAPAPANSHPSFSMAEGLEDLSELGLHGLRPIVRLLKAEAVLRMQQLPGYNHISSSAYVEMAYTETTDQLWASTLAVSWRWHRRLTSNADIGFTPMTPQQLALLKDALVDEGGEVLYVWVDFACCPRPVSRYRQQYVTELMRSKLYYARAGRMLVLPTVVMLPAENSISGLLAAASATLKGAAHLDARSVQIVRTVLHKLQGAEGLQLCKRDYFNRAWTLAERMARSGRGERLMHWLPLTSWMGMVADLLWVCTQPAGGRKVDGFPWACFNAGAGQQLRERLHEVAALFEAAARPKVPDSVVPDLLMAGLEVWGAPLPKVDVMAPEWLAHYLTTDANVLYIATDWRDTLAAFCSFYETDPQTATDPEAAAAMLCSYAGIPVQESQLFKQGLLEATADQELRAPLDIARASPGAALSFAGALPALTAALGAAARGARPAESDFDTLEGCLAARPSGPLSEEEGAQVHEMLVAAQAALRASSGPGAESQSAALRVLELLAAALPEPVAGGMRAAGLGAEALAALNKHPGLEAVAGPGARLLLHLADARALPEAPGPVLATLRRLLVTNLTAPALQEVLCRLALAVLGDPLAPPPPHACPWLMLLGDVTTSMAAHRGRRRLQALCCRLMGAVVRLPLGGAGLREELLQGLGRIGALTDLSASMEAHLKAPELQVEALGCLGALLAVEANRRKAADLRVLALVKEVVAASPDEAEVAARGGDAIAAAAADAGLLEQAASLRLLPFLEARLARWLARPEVLRALAAAAAALSAHRGMRAQARQSGLQAVLQSVLKAHPGDDVLGMHCRTTIANIIAP